MEFVELKKLVEIKKGYQVNRADLSQIQDDFYKYPVINGGRQPLGYLEKYNVEKNHIIVIEGADLAGFVNFINQKFWLGGHCYVLEPKENFSSFGLDYKFLFWYLKYKQDYLMSRKYGVRIMTISKFEIEKVLIPLPPLNQQQKIADLLTKWETAMKKLLPLLEREIEIRKIQYEAYLTNFVGKVEIIDEDYLENLIEIKRGVWIAKENLEQFKRSGNYPVYNGGINPVGFHHSYNDEGNGVTTISEAGSAGSIDWKNYKFWASDHCLRFVPIDSRITNKYIYFYLASKEKILKKEARGGASPRLPNQIIRKLIFKFPSLDKQNFINKNLTTLEISKNNIAVNLTNEIKFRQQQFQYYLSTIFQHLI